MSEFICPACRRTIQPVDVRYRPILLCPHCRELVIPPTGGEGARLPEDRQRVVLSIFEHSERLAAELGRVRGTIWAVWFATIALTLTLSCLIHFLVTQP